VGGANEQSIFSLMSKTYLMVVTVGKQCGMLKLYEAFLVRKMRNFFSILNFLKTFKQIKLFWFISALLFLKETLLKKVLKPLLRRHNIQLNDTQHNAIQHNNKNTTFSIIN
jgi:hypothetical protein